MNWRQRARRTIGPAQGAATGIAAVTGAPIGAVASISGMGGSVARAAMADDPTDEGAPRGRRAKRRARRAARRG